MFSHSRALIFLQSLITGLFVAALMSSIKIINIGPLRFTLGIVILTIAFCLIDVINQIYSKEFARLAVIYALITRLLLYPFVVSTIGWRVILATEVVTFFSQVVVDIPIFDWLKQYKMPFFFRTNLSNIISGAIGAFLFIIVAFYGVKPNIETLIFGQMLARQVLALLISPVTSIIVGVLNAEKN